MLHGVDTGMSIFGGIIFCSETDGIFLDYSRQCATPQTLDKLLKLAEVGWKLEFLIF